MQVGRQMQLIDVPAAPDVTSDEQRRAAATTGPAGCRDAIGSRLLQMGRAQRRPDRAAIGVASRADDLPYVCRSEAMDAAAAHVLVFPWPRQGHINPMLHLAAALVDAGVRVTFLHTDHSLRRLAQAPPPPRAMRVLSVPDGLPDDHSRGFLDLMDSMCATSGPAYRALLSSLVFGADDAPPVTCVVADGTMPFAVEVAEELGVPALGFAAHSACSYLAFLSTPELIELGETAFPADDPVCGVPGMEGFPRRRDLPRGLHCVERGNADPLVLKIAEVIARSCKAARALVVNTAASMERPALAHIASRTATDVFAVGPLHARLAATASSNASLWREDDGCMAWLDGQEDRSVVYVSLGSLAVITHEQFTEFLAGLAATGHAFLWVLRPDMVRTTSPALLREAVGAAAGGGDKARVVEWAPQRDVLRHMAVGCFLTHAGWNSTLECAVEGVPMVCWPFFADQQTNSRFVGAVWGTGLDMKDVCDRGVMARTVREAMASDETRAAARAMARQLRLDVAEAGSSSSELERLVRFIGELSLKPRINED